MRRRDLIIIIGGTALGLFAARAQLVEPTRRIGVLTGFSQADSAGRALLAAFRQQMAVAGWVEGRNLIIDIRWGNSNPEQLRVMANDLVNMDPDVVVVHGSQALTAVRRVTDKIPILFASISDPVAAGFVDSLAKPGGNITGFANYSGPPSPKLLEVLKEVSPSITRVAFMISPNNLALERQFKAMEGVAQALSIQVSSIISQEPGTLAPAIANFAQAENGGLVVTSDVFMITHREEIITAATQHRLPAIYQDRSFVLAGGLMSYSVDRRESYRRVAHYADRILRGAKPADLPVQQPEKFEFLLNLKAAKAINLDVPRIVLARADEVIE
jgi:putative ABC transport system substrate-binding protein